MRRTAIGAVTRGLVAPLALLLLVAGPVEGQSLSTRTEAFGRGLAGLFPDDWSDAVLNPALIAPGALAFGRLAWSAAESPGRRFLLGGRAAAQQFGLLFATSRGLDHADGGPGMEHTLVAARYGNADAVGFRYTSYSHAAAGHSPHGHAIAVGARTAAGKGWSAEFLAEVTWVGFADGRDAGYRAGELLLRQPGPERSPSHPGWDQRILRFRGGVGGGDYPGGVGDDPAQQRWSGDLRWLEAALVHLHAFDALGAKHALAWALRYTRYETEPMPCWGGDCGEYVGGRRGVLALDGGVEARRAAPVALRAGFTWAMRARGYTPLPSDWGYLAAVRPSRFRSGLWLGLGAGPYRALAVDVALDVRAADRSLERTPMIVQATYRF